MGINSKPKIGLASNENVRNNCLTEDALLRLKKYCMHGYYTGACFNIY
jgi:hypothetical protein